MHTKHATGDQHGKRERAEMLGATTEPRAPLIPRETSAEFFFLYGLSKSGQGDKKGQILMEQVGIELHDDTFLKSLFFCH